LETEHISLSLFLRDDKEQEREKDRKEKALTFFLSFFLSNLERERRERLLLFLVASFFSPSSYKRIRSLACCEQEGIRIERRRQMIECIDCVEKETTPKT